MQDAAATASRKEFIIYTDGGATPNPGAGGYGVVLRFGQHRKELSGGFRLTTNNRMELMAVIVALEALKEPCKVTLYSDSQYIVDALTSGAVLRWRDNDWRISPRRTKRAKNSDLWQRLLVAYECHEVEMVWVKGHAGIDDNERCDALAMTACQKDGLPPDPGFHGSEPARSIPVAAASDSLPKTKILFEGQPCRKCNTPVVKRTPKKRAHPRTRRKNAATRNDRNWIRLAELWDDELFRHLRRNLDGGRSADRREEEFERVRRLLDYEVPIVRMVIRAGSVSQENRR